MAGSKLIHSKYLLTTTSWGGFWRRVPESNRCTRICNPLRNHSANSPKAVPMPRLLAAIQTGFKPVSEQGASAGPLAAVSEGHPMPSGCSVNAALPCLSNDWRHIMEASPPSRDVSLRAPAACDRADAGWACSENTSVCSQSAVSAGGESAARRAVPAPRPARGRRNSGLEWSVTFAPTRAPRADTSHNIRAPAPDAASARLPVRVGCVKPAQAVL